MSEIQTKLCLAWFIACDTVPHTTEHRYSSRLIRKEFPYLAAKYFDNKPYFWTGAYFVASCGGVTIERLKKYVENQNSPKKVVPSIELSSVRGSRTRIPNCQLSLPNPFKVKVSTQVRSQSR
nr:transposase [Microcystis aeruginosa]